MLVSPIIEKLEMPIFCRPAGLFFESYLCKTVFEKPGKLYFRIGYHVTPFSVLQSQQKLHQISLSGL
jgi:hypothetical protein